MESESNNQCSKSIVRRASKCLFKVTRYLYHYKEWNEYIIFIHKFNLNTDVQTYISIQMNEFQFKMTAVPSIQYVLFKFFILYAKILRRISVSNINK